MKMKLMISALCFAFAVTLSAQQGSRGPRQILSDETIKELKLTEKQVSEINKLQDERRAMMEQTRTESNDRRAEMEKIRTNENKRMKEILTPDQFNQFETKRKESAERGRDGERGERQTRGEKPENNEKKSKETKSSKK